VRRDAGRVLVVLAGLGLAALLVSPGYDFWASVAVAAAVTATAGAIANRSWTIAVPFAVAIGASVLFVIDGGLAEDPRGETTPAMWIMVFLFMAAIAGVAILAGMGIRRALTKASGASDPRTTRTGS
jgi:hypothetical protein